MAKRKVKKKSNGKGVGGKADVHAHEEGKRNKSLLGHNAIFTPDLTSNDKDWLKRKLKVAEIGENFDVSKMTKIVAGKKLWNYDNLEPTEKKGAI